MNQCFTLCFFFGIWEMTRTSISVFTCFHNEKLLVILRNYRNTLKRTPFTFLQKNVDLFEIIAKKWERYRNPS